jgi:hypothetical protein
MNAYKQRTLATKRSTSDFYCDIQKEDGVWGIYFRDKITEQEAHGEPNETND